jgi:hypothetical protein
VFERCYRLGFTQEAGQFIRSCQLSAKQHLDRHRAIQLELLGLVNHAHAAAAENRVDLITGDERQRGREVQRPLGISGAPGCREHLLDLCFHILTSFPALADLPQQFGSVGADFLRSSTGIQRFFEQLQDSRFIMHRVYAPAGGAG